MLLILIEDDKHEKTVIVFEGEGGWMRVRVRGEGEGEG
jgi:hypothetical protein